MLAALAALSAAVLLFELTLTRLLSVALFYPFAFVALSVAMLGLTAGAVGVATSRRLAALDSERIFSGSALFFAAAMIVGYPLWNALPLDPMSLLASPVEPLLLFGLLALLVVPFVFAGVFVARIFADAPGSAPRLYVADLGGAAAGTLIFALGVGPVGAVGMIGIAAALAVGAAVMARPRTLAWRAGLGLLTAALIGAAPWLERLVPLRITADKLLGTAIARELPRGQRWSVSSAIDVIPGDDGMLLVIDGGAAMTLVPRFERGRPPPMPTGLRALPYVLGPGKSTVVVGSGGGVEVLAALGARSERVIAIEIDPVINALVMGELLRSGGALFTHPSVELHTAEARTFLASRPADEHYDAIVAFHTISNAAGGTQAVAMSESYTLTVEAMRLFLSRLSDDGVLIISRPEEQLGRLAATVGEAWRSMGRADLENHVAVVTQTRARPDFLSALVLRSRPFDAAALAELRRVVPGRLAYLPGGSGDSQAYFHAALTFPEAAPAPSYRAASLEPTTDDRPFFNMPKPWHELAWSDVRAMLGAGKQARARLEDVPVAQLAVLAALLQLTVLGALVLLPAFVQLRRRGVAPKSIGAGALVASGCGLGFMLLEVGLVQMLARLVGEPGVALVLVVGGLLLSAGIGSVLFAGRQNVSPRRAALVAVGTAVIVAVLVPWVVDVVSPLGFGWRALVAALLVGVVGLGIGSPLAAFLRLVGARAEVSAWIWATNGFASVLAAVLALILASSVGLRATALVAAVAYGLVALVVAPKSAGAPPVRDSGG